MKALPVLPGDAVSEMARTLQTMPADSLRLSELRDAFYLATIDRVLTCLASYTEDVPLQESLAHSMYRGIPSSLAQYPIQQPFYAWVDVWVRETWQRAVHSPQPSKAPKERVRLTAEQCPYGLGRSVCDRMDAKLKDAKIRPAQGSPRLRLKDCGDCQLPSVSSYLANHPTKRNTKWLSKLGFSFVYLYSGPGLPSAPYYCTLVGASIVEPCETTSCASYVSHPWSHNCLQVHIQAMQRAWDDHLARLTAAQQQALKAEPLGTPAEIAVVLNQPIPDVVKGLQSALTRARSEVLCERKHEGSVPPDFEDWLLSQRVLCVTCEKPLPREPVVSRGEKYCSPQCRSSLSPSHVSVERRYGLSYHTMLKYAKASFPTIEEAYAALGLPAPPTAAPDVPTPPRTQPPELLRSASQKSKGLAILKRTGRKPVWLTSLETVLSRRLEALRIPGFQLALD